MYQDTELRQHSANSILLRKYTAEWTLKSIKAIIGSYHAFSVDNVASSWYFLSIATFVLDM